MKAENLNVTPIYEPVPSQVPDATVISVSNGAIEIEVAGVARSARLAFSCLVRPEPNDIVIYSRQTSGVYIVLGIIERPGQEHMTIELKGDTTFRNTSGSVSMMTNESISLLAGKKINCLSDQVFHKSREAVIDYCDTIAQGKNLQASFTNIRVFSDLMCSMARQVIDRFKSYIRHSDEFDQVKAGQMTREVSGLFSMDTKYTVMVSKKDTKIDGERIHMG